MAPLYVILGTSLIDGVMVLSSDFTSSRSPSMIVVPMISLLSRSILSSSLFFVTSGTCNSLSALWKNSILY